MQIRRCGIEASFDSKWSTKRQARFQLLMLEDIDGPAADQIELILQTGHRSVFASISAASASFRQPNGT
jgi:hypothetical protein